MQIVEVKNDIAKIKYNSANNHLLPSDFILIEDNSLKFIAQVINIETTDDSVLNNADLRLCLFIDENDNLSFYNGYVISKNAKVNYISSEEIIDLISDDNNNIYFGNLANHSNTYVKTSSSFVNDKLYIQSDKNEKTSIIVKNLVSQLVSVNKKVVILDFDNQYTNIENAYLLKIGEDIKLPLNIPALDNILEKDIEDCLLEDKALIQSIILELREYIQTLPEKFLQFSLFRDVINSQYNENPISGLMVLRNKLWLYAQNNLFADKDADFAVLNDELLNSSCIVIDASSVSEKWQNVLIQIIKEIISDECYLILNLDGIDANKKLINDIYAKENIIPIFSSSYSNSCRALLSLLSKNQILCKPSSFINENVQYVDFVNKLNHEEFIIFGESTLYLPLILSIQQFDSNTVNSVIENDIKRDVDKLLSGGSATITEEKQLLEDEERKEIIESSVLLQNDYDESSNIQNSEDPYFNEKVGNEVEYSHNEAISYPQDDVLDDDLDFLDEMSSDEIVIIEDNKEVENSDLEVQSQELYSQTNIEENSSNRIIFNEEDVESIHNIQSSEDVQDEQVDSDETIESVNADEEESQYNNDVKVVNNEEEQVDDDGYNQEVEVDSDFSDEDVENEYQEEETSEETVENVLDEFDDVEDQKSDDYQIDINEDINTKEPQEIPIYETDIQQKLNQDDLPFKVGDKVFHPKHGNGVVQGFTNYSDKILFCQIEFENVGRRILDPRVAQIEKV